MKNKFLETEIHQLMKREHVPGLSLVIIEDGEIESRHEFGLKNSQASEPIDADTVFEAASLSKPVFAYGILQMVEKGLLNLDVPLIHYLPYPDIENDPRLKLITSRMVLAHTTGFPNWRNQGESLKIYFQPNEKFSYSGEGFVFLQKVAEHLLEQSIEDYLKKNVFQPLKMTQSSFVWKNKYEALRATGHNSAGEPMENPRFFAANAAFTLYTTALDYAKFVIAIMQEVGLKPETINLMMTPQIRVEEGCVHCVHKQLGKLSDSISWGLGWGLQQLVQGDSFWHWGDNPGFKSYIVGLRSKKQAIIIFTNSSSGLGLSIIPSIIHKIWGTWQPAFDWIETEKVPF